MAKKSVSDTANEIILIGTSGMAYIPGIKAAVTISAKPSRDMFSKPDNAPIKIAFKDKAIKGVVPWGENNDLPQQLIAKIRKSETLSGGLYFNYFCGYGDGIMPCYYVYNENGKKTILPYEFMGEDLQRKIKETTDNEEKNELNKRYKLWESTFKEVAEFFENNDIEFYLGEQFIDINFFYIAFAEIIFNKDSERKIVVLTSKEAAFSRFEEMDKETGLINHHFYSSKWSESAGVKEDDIDITPVLNPRSTIRDLKIRTGMIPGPDGEKKDEEKNRYIIPIILPSPGKFYYPHSPWYSVFESGWYDLLTKIPELKNALVDNQMTLKYHIELDKDYFPDIFRDERIIDEKKQKERIKKEFENLNDFLSNKENTGKSIISYTIYTPDGTEKRKMKINVLENHFKGGEYIEDSEEGSNIMNFAMGVHPSLIGSSPGKTKTINGTEARELYLIKQSLQKPIRDRILKPLYIVKVINGWDPRLHFTIPNIQLTTLDEGKETEKVAT